jgi:hypothetical protein
MLRVLRRPLALLLLAGTLAGMSVGGFPTTAPSRAAAADPAWTIPTSPPRCTQAQADSGLVSGCVLMAGPGLPESRGWPTAPFPVPQNPTVVAWVNLSLGAKDTTVAKVQEALNKRGATLIADGQFGSQTYTAVKAFQTANGMTATGVVDKPTAAKLGVQRTTGGTFPPTGWKWLGWGYNGSPALAAFEKQLVANTKPIGSMRVGQLRSFADALPLFEHFYAEIQAKGYVINDGGTWVFRCTASTRKDCAGQTKYSLSNHAFGLASDINTVKNPMVRYYPVNGVTACSTPVKTDMPRWVVQTAEKWGLYWGGYGWTSGCQTPTQWRASVSRDPMHFEFNGSPAQAQAILRRNLGSGRCIDVVNEAGQPVNWCLMKGEIPAAGTRLAVNTGAPTGATVAVVNVVTLDAKGPGYFTAEDCGARAKGLRTWSNGNVRVGRTTATLVVVPVDSKGRFCLYQSAAVNTVIDVQGYFAPSAVSPTGALFTPVSPIRTLDTGATTYCGPDGTCNPPGPTAPGTELLNIAPTTLTPVAALSNLTITSAAAGGYVTAGSCDALVPGPQPYSNLNVTVPDPATANMAVVPVANTEIGATFCTFATSSVHEVVHVTGFFNPPEQGGLGFAVQTPHRMVDTRKCWTDPITAVQRCAQLNGAGSIVRLAAPAGASAVLVNLTATDATAAGNIVAAACSTFDANGSTSPALPAVVGAVTSNLAAVPVGPDGTFCVKVTAPTHLVVDLIGTFSPTGDLRYSAATPHRIVNTR